METISLQANLRERGSKGSVRALRSQGMVPAVLYGKEVGNILLSVPTRDLDYIIANHSISSTLINLDVDKRDGRESYLVMCREIQRDPMRRELLHADFYQVVLTEEIETEIPVVLIGESPGVKQGGILQHMLRSVVVSCLPMQLPERLEADISNLEIGGQLTVGDIEPPSGVRIVSGLDSIIALVVPPAVEEVEEEQGEEEGVEAGAAPEQGEA